MQEDRVHLVSGTRVDPAGGECGIRVDRHGQRMVRKGPGRQVVVDNGLRVDCLGQGGCRQNPTVQGVLQVCTFGFVAREIEGNSRRQQDADEQDQDQRRQRSALVPP